MALPSVVSSSVRGITSRVVAEDQTITRRSGNYRPALLDYNYIQSLTSDFVEDSYAIRIEKLKEDVRLMLENKAMNRLDQLELIDTIQRLGVEYCFQDEINRILARIDNDKRNNNVMSHGDLCTEALEFILLRQHGFKVSPETFSIFKDNLQKFKACLCEDVEGLLSLYEASFLAEEGESMLEEARDFAVEHLKEYVNYKKGDYISMLVSHTLELPLHWRMARLEARWFMGVYQSKHDMNPLLLEFAKMEYNNLQAVHQEDLKRASEWWQHTGFSQKLPFARERIAECFIGSLGLAMELQYSYFRTECTKIIQLATTIDDIYDVYGTLEELEIFTSAVERWDLNMMDRLPEYMKLPFLALVNLVNEIAYIALRDHGVDILYFLKKSWTDLCKSFLVEHKWYQSGYKPTLQEYLDNGWITIGGPVILLHTYFLIANPITDKAMEFLKGELYPNIIKRSSMIFRLANDLATSSHELQRGDVPKSIQCYMHETGASEEESRAHFYDLISETWMKLNTIGGSDTSFCREFALICMNMVRTAQQFYQQSDEFGIVDRETKGRFLELLVQPALLK